MRRTRGLFRLLRLCAWLGVLHGLVACGGSDVTTRVISGRTIQGRYIDSEAYEAFLRGAYQEELGNFDYALAFYDLALDFDGDSPELWLRVGVVRCRLEHDDADEAFSQAIEADSHYAPAFRERARCLLARRQPKLALAPAKRAVAEDPGDVSASVLMAEILEVLGEAEQAGRWLVALGLQTPESPAVWRALGAHAQRVSSDALVGMAAEGLNRLSLDEQTAEGSHSSADLERLIASGELEQARVLAEQLNVAPEQVGWIAYRMGRPQLAVKQASLLARADPENVDMLVLWLAALDAAGEEDEFATALAHVRVLTRPSGSTHSVFAELLRSRVGKSAAGLYLAAQPESLRDGLEVDVANARDRETPTAEPVE